MVGGVEVHDGNGVLRAVGDVERLSLGIEGEGVGRGAEEIAGLWAHPDGLDDPAPGSTVRKTSLVGFSSGSGI